MMRLSAHMLKQKHQAEKVLLTNCHILKIKYSRTLSYRDAQSARRYGRGRQVNWGAGELYIGGSLSYQ